MFEIINYQCECRGARGGIAGGSSSIIAGGSAWIIAGGSAWIIAGGCGSALIIVDVFFAISFK